MAKFDEGEPSQFQDRMLSLSTKEGSLRMVLPRLIPLVTLLNQNVVKTVQFSDPKYIGDPINTVALFSELMANEICLLDIGKSHNEPRVSLNYIETLANNCSVPLSYGGGISNLQKVHEVLSLGVDKLVIKNSWRDMNLIHTTASIYGAQSICICLEVQAIDSKIMINGEIFAFNELEDILIQLEEAGMGELMILDRNMEGTRSGFSQMTVTSFSRQILGIPMIISGGFSNFKTAADIVTMLNLQGAMVGSAAIYHRNSNSVLINYPTRNEWKELCKVNS